MLGEGDGWRERGGEEREERAAEHRGERSERRRAREVYGGPSIPCVSAAPGEPSCASRATYPRTEMAFFPDARLRGGPSDGLHGEVGVGAYTPAMLHRPGVHIGLGYSTRAGHDLTARCGVQSTVGDDRALRCDLSGALPLNEVVTLGLGGAVVDSDERVNFDARASVTVHFGDR